jgi:hypothetical protein
VAESQLTVVQSEPLAVAASQPLGSERTRVDTNTLGVDHEQLQQKIANWASTLPPALQQPAARMGTYYADVLASLAELMSAPESIATMGAKPALAAMDATGAAITRLKSAVGRVSVNPGAAVEQFSLTQPQKMLKAISVAEQPVAERVPGFDRYLPNQSVAPSTPAIAPPVEPVATPAPAPPRSPRSVNDAMADAVRKAQAQAKAARAAKSAGSTSPAETARGGTAPRGDRPAAATPGESPAPPPAAESAATLRLTPPEAAVYTQLRAAGKTDAQAREAIAAMRKLAANLPTDAAVRQTVKGRNTTGKWPGPEEQR